MKLDNCSWEYPFNLASFNQNNTLRTLRVIYSHDNTFVLLERYEDYLRHSFQGHSASLLHISFAFVDSHMYTSHLSPIILKTFLQCFIELEELHFIEWTTNLGNLRRVSTRRVYEKPLTLHLELYSFDGDKRLLRRVQRLNLRVWLSQIEGEKS